MIFHSDLGSQYTSNEYENLLVKNKVKHSYSKKGYPYDNAPKEVAGNTFTDYKVNNQLINKIYNEKLTKDEIINKSYGINLLSIIIYRIISLVLCLIGIALLSFNIISSLIVLSLCVSIIYFKFNVNTFSP